MATTQLTPWSGADGAAASAANTGFASVVKTDTAATMLFESSWKPRAVNSLEMRGTTTAGYALGVIQPGTTSDAIAVDVPIMMLEMPTAEQAVVSFHEAADGRQFSISLYPDGILRVRNGANTGIWDGTIDRSAVGALALNAKTILRIFLQRDAAAGQYHVQLVNEADGSVRANTGLRTAQNTGSTTISHVKVGAKTSASSTSPTKLAIGVPRYDWAATGLIPLWAPPAAHKPFRFSNGTAWVTPRDVVYSDGSVWRSILGEG